MVQEAPMVPQYHEFFLSSLLYGISLNPIYRIPAYCLPPSTLGCPTIAGRPQRRWLRELITWVLFRGPYHKLEGVMTASYGHLSTVSSTRGCSGYESGRSLNTGHKGHCSYVHMGE